MKADRTLVIVVPVFNEEDALNDFLRRLGDWLAASRASLPLVSVVVVDDGSSTRIRPVAARHTPTYLLRHKVNLGQGAALQTGIEFARDRLNAQLFATMDSDGQHRPEDLPTLLDTLNRARVDIVFGNRFRGESNVPTVRRWILGAALRFERLLTGLKLSDSHNGFRVFTRECAAHLRLRQNRMAHATEFKQIVARHRLRYAEAPVDILYTAQTRAKGQSNLGAVTILRDLAHSFLFGRF